MNTKVLYLWNRYHRRKIARYVVDGHLMLGTVGRHVSAYFFNALIIELDNLMKRAKNRDPKKITSIMTTPEIVVQLIDFQHVHHDLVGLLSNSERLGQAIGNKTFLRVPVNDNVPSYLTSTDSRGVSYAHFFTFTGDPWAEALEKEIVMQMQLAGYEFPLIGISSGQPSGQESYTDLDVIKRYHEQLTAQGFLGSIYDDVPECDTSPLVFREREIVDYIRRLIDSIFGIKPKGSYPIIEINQEGEFNLLRPRGDGSGLEVLKNLEALAHENAKNIY